MSIETLKILNNFFAYTEKISLELLEGDKKYIHHVSMGIPEERLKIALMAYIEAWMAAMKSEEQEIRKQGAGRRAANISIREFLR